MTQAFKHYTITEGDTLESIALKFLGTASRWQEIAQLNKLRQPYLSDDPAQKQGPRLAQYLLPCLLSQGQTQIGIADGDATVLVERNIAFFDAWDASGARLWETKSIASYDQGTAILTLKEGLSRAYPAPHWLYIFPDPDSLTTKVLGTSDTLLLPLQAGAIGAVLGAEELASLLGADLALDKDGRLSWNVGDLDVASGVDNLKQQLAHRLTTALGELSRHGEYGSHLPSITGEAARGYFPILVKGVVLETLLADPRVARVADYKGTVKTGGVYEVEVAVEMRQASVVLYLERLALMLV